jgi:hypothetical protein
MLLCVGAASRRIVEEAAKLQVHQIVASRRQVAYPTGYIGLSPKTLVALVRELSHGETLVVRDHGGPLQGGFDDDGTAAFDADVAAGFDGLHIDVCELPRDEQCERLVQLCKHYRGNSDVQIEVGGEHESPAWNTQLLSAVIIAGVRPSYVVVGAGTHVWADQQIGYVKSESTLRAARAYAHKMNIRTKVHNMDWVGNRLKLDVFDAYNLAPELGQVEVRAVLTALPPNAAIALLEYAYNSGKWQRWFHADEGTRAARAECALRYLLEDDEYVDTYISPDWSSACEDFVRRCVRDAIIKG